MSGRFITRELYAMLTEGFTFNHHIIGNENLLIPRFASLMKQAVFALSPVFLGLVLVAIGGSAVLGGLILVANLSSLIRKNGTLFLA